MGREGSAWERSEDCGRGRRSRGKQGRTGGRRAPGGAGREEEPVWISLKTRTRPPEPADLAQAADGPRWI